MYLCRFAGKEFFVDHIQRNSSNGNALTAFCLYVRYYSHDHPGRRKLRAEAGNAQSRLAVSLLYHFPPPCEKISNSQSTDLQQSIKNR